jgi:ATP-binding protein involved in chromosome partitioning
MNNGTLTEKEVLTALQQVIDPELRRSIVDMGMVRDLKVDDGHVAFTLALTVPNCPLVDQITMEAREAVAAIPGVKNVVVSLDEMTAAERAAALGPTGPSPLAGDLNRVAAAIAVMSGKGGVGKSLVAALAAVELARAGYRVGVLDADVTGPSIPRLFGATGPVTVRGNGLEPIESRTGIKLMSINFLLDEEGQAVIWRGPLIASAITQFWNDVHWGELDYLLVDLPPGTSDAALTVMQTIPLNGILMVTTPQALASMVVRKAVRMAQTVSVPILGIVENMAGFTAPDTGKHYEIFGRSYSGEVAMVAGAPVLARLPLDPHMAIQCDTGNVEAIIRPEFAEVTAAMSALVRTRSPAQGIQRQTSSQAQ